MEFQDLSLQCIDCHQSFVFTAGEQQFYERKGFKETPKRCKTCREARKVRRDQGGGGSAGDAGDFERENTGNRAFDGNRGGGGGRGTSAARGGAGAGAGAGGSVTAGAGGDREMFEAVCAACGAQTRVPFRPVGGRPVYCRDCYGNRSGNAE